MGAVPEPRVPLTTGQARNNSWKAAAPKSKAVLVPSRLRVTNCMKFSNVGATTEVKGVGAGRECGCLKGGGGCDCASESAEGVEMVVVMVVAVVALAMVSGQRSKGDFLTPPSPPPTPTILAFVGRMAFLLAPCSLHNLLTMIFSPRRDGELVRLMGMLCLMHDTSRVLYKVVGFSL